MVKHLKILIGISIVASVLTLLTPKLGLGELYPFTSWKLFTQPICSFDTYTHYNLYGKDQQGAWQLLPLRSSNNFDYDDTYYLFDELSNTIAENPKRIGHLRSLAKAMYPDHNDFELRTKSYKVSEIVRDSSLFQEDLIAKF